LLALRARAVEPAPVITLQPQSQHLAVGSNFSLTVAASSQTLVTYQWQAYDGVGWTDIAADNFRYANATTAQLDVVSAWHVVNGTQFRCIVTNGGGSATSEPATYTMFLTPPQIGNQPQSKTLVTGAPLHLEVAANYFGTSISYQWLKDGQPIDGATNNFFDIPVTAQSNGGEYRAMLTDSIGTSISDIATVRLLPRSGGISGAAAYATGLFIKADGSLWGMGYGMDFGHDANAIVTPEYIAEHVVQVVTDGTRTLFLKDDSSLWLTGMVFAISSHDPTEIIPVPVQVATGVVTVSAGSSATYYLKSDGSLWAMGRDNFGQLGDGAMAYRATPVQIATDVRAVAGGFLRMFFIKADSTLWAVGLNQLGALGDGTFTDRPTPVQVATSVRSVSTSSDTTLFVKSDNTLWGCGNIGYLLSDPDPFNPYGNNPRPAPIQLATDVIEAAAGDNHVIYLKSDGMLWGRGGNSVGQLGIGNFSTQRSPVPIASNVTAVAATDEFSMFFKSDGSVWTMGWDQWGMLGNGPLLTDFQPIPGQISSGPIAAPGAPTGLAAASGAGFVGVRLSWDPVIGTQGYEVWRNTVAVPASAIRVADRVPAGLHYDDTATPGVSYFYWVKATNPAGASAFSAPVSIIPGTLLPVITLQPVNATADTGVDPVFRIMASGDPTPAYQWQILRAGSGIWSSVTEGGHYAGATTLTLTVLQAIPLMSGDRFRCVATNAAGAAISNAAALAVIGHGSVDFNGDGHPDLLWQNSVTGQRAIWTMNGTTPVNSVPLINIPIEWDLVGTADFNGDGKPDLIWQNTTTGERAIWLMDGTTPVASRPLITIPLEWDLVGATDFNGDSKPDLLWQNTVTGQRAIWIMDGTTPVSSVPLINIPIEWDLVGTADFNGDGKPDLIWQNTTTGERAIWLMDGTTPVASRPLITIPLEWDLVGARDFDGDGKPDLLWQNTTTGERAIWLMDGTTPVASRPLITIPTEWVLAK
ncbi:MAG: repeat protein, partial [Lacunisphaera sp.]|nr:repeat protein [Lacunisphaera sp.]